MTRLRLATRGSPLALWQAETVKACLERAHPGISVSLVIVKTSGDVVVDRPIPELGSTGVFTKEVDRLVVEGRADAAVHSLKDLATTLEPELTLAAHLERGAVEDVLIAPLHQTLAALPRGAVVATGSLRRAAMLLRVRPDLVMVGSRGNVATRLERVDGHAVHATVLARAGLDRLGLVSCATEVLSVDIVLPAVGQAIVGVTCRADDATTRLLLAAIDNPMSHACALAERALLRALRAGCHAPVGGHAVVDGSKITLRGRVLSKDGSEEVLGVESAPLQAAESLGIALAEKLVARGAARLLAGESI